MTTIPLRREPTMTDTLVRLRMSQLSRVLMAILLLVLFAGGTGVVVADGEDNSGTDCPEDSPNQGGDHASGSGAENSADGRQEAIEGTECD